MIKKILAISICVITIAMGIFANTTVSAAPPRANLKPSDYETGISFAQALKGNKPIAVCFYVDWCGYCKKFVPVLDKLSKEYKNKFVFVFVNCDAPANKKYVKDFYVEGFPTLYLVNPKNDNRVYIPNSLYANPSLLRKEFNRFLKVNAIK